MKTSQELLATFESFKVIQILREENSHTDALASLGLAFGIIIKRVIPFTYLDEPSIESMKSKEMTKNVEELNADDWKKKIID